MPVIFARTVIAIVFLGFGLLAPADAEDLVARDRAGQTIGTLRPDPYGSGYVLRDRAGQTIGILKPDAYGSGFVLRDRAGRTVGTLERE
ncbi:MAG: hypothetical protein WD044_08715 [Dongiaceae bacterium]